MPMTPGRAARLALVVLRAYRARVSPLLPASCRFVPSCSAYAEEAILAHGVLRGMTLAARRLARCHPLGGHGLDLVPTPPTDKGR